MFDVRFHGRGGQGVVTAAEVLSVAAFDNGLHAQAFPTFGSERTGAPVTSFCRISEQPIRFHEPIEAPQAIVVQDPTLLAVAPVLDGATPTTYVLVNSSRSPAELGVSPDSWDRPGRVITFPASGLAREVLGRPLPNTALLGALAAVTGIVPIDALAEAIRQRFAPEVAGKNVDVAIRAHALVGSTLDGAEVVGRA